MGFLDSLFGRKDNQQDQNYSRNPYGRENYPRQDVRPDRPQNADEQALARYRYMLQTAPPEDIERAHEEAFSKLTPEQRQMALQQMSQHLPDSERRNLSDDPRSLARAATRAEFRQPGAIGSMLGGGGMGGGMMGGGMMGGMGGMLAGSLLASVAGSFIGGSIANSFFSNPANEQAFQGSPEAAAVDGGVTDFGESGFQETGLDASADPLGDPGAIQETGLDASADPYGDPADSGGFMDTGGNDFDFGGGDDFGGDF